MKAPAKRDTRMLARMSLALCAFAFVAGCDSGTDAGVQDGGPAPVSLASPQDLHAQADQQWSMLGEYCTSCHNAEDWAGGLSMDLLDPANIGQEAAVWEKVIRKLRGRMMPPPGQERPDTHRMDAFVAWMEASIDQAEIEADPGYVPLHRMNRTEYANAVRDLLALDVDARELLPEDGAEDGFDNVASALQVSPLFIDQYLNAARVLSEQAIGSSDARSIGVPYSIPAEGQLFHVEGLPLGTRGGAVIEHYFPADGEYLLNIGNFSVAANGLTHEHVNTVVALIDGKQFFELEIGGDEDRKAIDQLQAPAVDSINARLKNIPFTTSAGPHRIAVTFLQRSFAEADAALRLLTPGGGQDAVLSLRQLEIMGPVQATGLSNTPSRQKIFICYPDGLEIQAPACASEVIGNIAAQAFRGSLNSEDMKQLLLFYAAGAEQGGFEEGIKYAISGILAHPKFLFRMEAVPEGAEPGHIYALNDIDLASRLSFFLWSTIPDQELLQVAAAGTLGDPQVLEQQVRRMLADPRSKSLATNFAYQWLGLGELDSIDPDPLLFSDVDRRIRTAFKEEATLFVDSIFRADDKITDLLTAQHTYLNETLALHYGINDIKGDRFRRVELADERRWGLLGKGGVLMVSSYPNRTSPVLRGAWLLEKIVGTPPAAPPPEVEGLVENVLGETATTVRERLEVHRANPSCNGCHGIIDPLGFALENFDAVGRWREKDLEAGTVIDPSGVLPDGHPLNGPLALRNSIMERPEQFIQTFTEKLLTFALGRTLEYRDMPAVRRIVRESAKDEYRFSTLVLNIVASDQFRKKRLPEAEGLSVGLAAEPAQ